MKEKKQLQPFIKWYESQKEKILADFFDLLRIPSISTLASQKKEVSKAAFWTKKKLSSWGFQTEVIKTSHQDCIFAKRIYSQKAKTLLFYGHFDVQPVDPLELWKTPPFEPRLEKDTVYARGAVDNKGQMFYTLTALHAFLELYPKAPINIKVLLEGEEESGSMGTKEVLKTHKAKLKADELYIVDFDMRGENDPTLALGARGIMALELKLSNAKTDLHSGVHGGIALNPLKIAAELVSSFWDENGHIAIEGFYEGMQTLSAQEKALIDWKFDKKKYQKRFGIKVLSYEKGVSPLEANWTRPVLEVNGIQGGYVGPGVKTVIPKEACLKLSCRLVPDQDPKQVFLCIEKHIKEQMPTGLDFKLTSQEGSRGFLIPLESTCVKKAKEAFEMVFDKKCGFILCGASVPIAPLLQKASGASMCLMGLGLDSDNIHAPNEHFSLTRFFKGFLIISRILYKSAYRT